MIKTVWKTLEFNQSFIETQIILPLTTKLLNLGCLSLILWRRTRKQIMKLLRRNDTYKLRVDVVFVFKREIITPFP